MIRKFQLVLILMLLVFSTGCAQKTIEPVSNPSFPLPSDDVANELQTYCYPKEKCPAFWGWLNDLYKLKDQLEN